MINFAKPSRRIKRIFVHCSASNRPDDTIEKIKNLHSKPKNISILWNGKWVNCFGWKGGVGYHYLVDYRGNIETGRPLDNIPSAQRGFNKESIAICVLGDGIYCKAQYNSLTHLVSIINEEYNNTIPIYGHRDVNNLTDDPKYYTTKTCPKFDVKVKLGLDDNNLLIREDKKMVVSALALTAVKKLGVWGFEKLKSKAKDKVLEKVNGVLGKYGITKESDIDNLTAEQIVELRKEVVSADKDMFLAELDKGEDLSKTWKDEYLTVFWPTFLVLLCMVFLWSNPVGKELFTIVTDFMKEFWLIFVIVTASGCGCRSLAQSYINKKYK